MRRWVSSVYIFCISTFCEDTNRATDATTTFILSRRSSRLESSGSGASRRCFQSNGPGLPSAADVSAASSTSVIATSTTAVIAATAATAAATATTSSTNIAPGASTPSEALEHKAEAKQLLQEQEHRKRSCPGGSAGGGGGGGGNVDIGCQPDGWR